ncbi:ABC-three component system protein [Grimontia sp. SpTr1]|uniref:ABC-three component system protein n=1 Tax=Grimontia sp. SpTr1 TaxID=2995319 RepID=UPI00248BEDA2|nr:ABC-three component system protein [Grimontia sp. SpTr1]
MDKLQRAFYGKDIRIALLEKKEQEYENFFCSLMQKKYSDNFLPIKAAGREGDRKADGYLYPEKHVYQVYAPSSGFKKDKLIAKIQGDFEGAKEKWKGKILRWTFVHNEFEGLPPYAVDVISRLREENPNIQISVMGPDILQDFALSLSPSHLIDLFGLMPNEKQLAGLTHEPIKTLLKAIQTTKCKTSTLGPVSVDKLEFNALSDDVEILLKSGRAKEVLVQDLLSMWPDPSYGDDLASSFNSRYLELKNSGLEADLIFSNLQKFAGYDPDSIGAQVSSLAVLSYFFERCDIFDNPPEGWSK